MNTRYAVGRNEYARMTSQELRDTFLLNNLFEKQRLTLNYCEVERVVIGSAVPGPGVLPLDPGPQLAADFFCQRRELGIMNIGAPGRVTVDGRAFPLKKTDALYVGLGSRDVLFASDTPEKPAMFYLVSYPAHARYPTRKMTQEDANRVELGSREDSNERVIYQYIHEGGTRSCQLVMGYTRLRPGSVWNTMPWHTHERRTEVYMYFDVRDNACVFHFLGQPQDTRHLIVREGEAVISPMWSVHGGCGTGDYSFVWSMGGENQCFNDMDGVQMQMIQ